MVHDFIIGSNNEGTSGTFSLWFIIILLPKELYFTFGEHPAIDIQECSILSSICLTWHLLRQPHIYDNKKFPASKRSYMLPITSML